MNEIIVCGQEIANQTVLSGSFFSEWFLFLSVAFIAAAYLLGILLLRKQNGVWNTLNAIAFFIGIAMLLVAFSPNLMVSGYHSI